ncbi:hypothetical protein FHR83_006109 [Actinoplanes campanulatus]|uniref:Uncharacterized protein n=1 Tax=Actinoplanes campanulatus TaxID=113559 RepID=A0A7W5FHE7_9ACTN|nr:hypothetical protein [Actinoplanes campanulatus]MBB3098410.1 hypothetical protein [Actinoplanes campanulatus]GGN35097.1 hypothetical protein GCM10010109_58790 [Actinoplanes campanulatus]GID39103.1 hypothetical protein Aca09nite_56090 [Actinoplanes campanulatus]
MSQEIEVIGPAPVLRFSVLIPTGHGIRVTDGLVEFRFRNPATLGGRPCVTVWNETTGTAVTGHEVRMDGSDIVIGVRADVVAEMTALSVTVIG